MQACPSLYLPSLHGRPSPPTKPCCASALSITSTTPLPASLPLALLRHSATGGTVEGWTGLVRKENFHVGGWKVRQVHRHGAHLFGMEGQGFGLGSHSWWCFCTIKHGSILEEGQKNTSHYLPLYLPHPIFYTWHEEASSCLSPLPSCNVCRLSVAASTF